VTVICRQVRFQQEQLVKLSVMERAFCFRFLQMARVYDTVNKPRAPSSGYQTPSCESSRKNVILCDSLMTRARLTRVSSSQGGLINKCACRDDLKEKQTRVKQQVEGC
jgi:hypothetical protein